MSYSSLPSKMGYSGSTLVYSNNPEEIKIDHIGLLRNAGRFTIGTTIPKGQTYNFEYYHVNYSGGPLRIAVALINDTGSPIQYKISREGVATGIVSTGTVQIASKCNTKFYNSSARWDTIPSGSTYLVADSGKIAAQTLANGKVEIVPSNGDLKARVVFYDPDNRVQSEAATCTRVVDDGKLRTTALFRRNHRSISLNLNANRGKTFLLFPANVVSNWKTFNSGEYPQSASDAIAGVDGVGTEGSGFNTKWLCLGNFAVVYDLNLSNCAGRSIKFSKANGGTGILMARANNGTWYAKNLPFTYEASSTTLLQLILIGGNSGDVAMQIV